MNANATFGSVVLLCLGLYGTAQAATYAFRTIDSPGSTSTQPLAINDLDQIVGSYTVGGIRNGFLFSNGIFSTLSIAPGFTYPSGINDSGQIVGVGGAGVFLDTNGTVTTISLPAPTGTGVPGINNLGQVVGSFDDSEGKHVYVFSNGVLTIIDALTGASALGINDSGDIVGFLHGCFVYANGAVTTISVPGGTCVQVSGINDSGQIVGIFDDINGEHGFVDTNNLFTTINAPGAFATNAFGINDLGQIVGQYATTVAVQGFLASPIPEPATMLLLASGLGLLNALKRGSQRAK
jgi:probable HAF family extracellular repeat protein